MFVFLSQFLWRASRWSCRSGITWRPSARVCSMWTRRSVRWRLCLSSRCPPTPPSATSAPRSESRRSCPSCRTDRAWVQTLAAASFSGGVWLCCSMCLSPAGAGSVWWCCELGAAGVSAGREWREFRCVQAECGLFVSGSERLHHHRLRHRAQRSGRWRAALLCLRAVLNPRYKPAGHYSYLLIISVVFTERAMHQNE